MEQIKIDVVKQWLINKKEFSTLEVIKTLEKENAELKKKYEELKNTYKKQRNKRIDELQKENAKLKQQIEKMKCCGNCTYRDLDKYVFPCDCCKRWHGKKSYNDCWEFAE